MKNIKGSSLMAAMVAMVLSGPGCSGVSSEYKNGMIKEIDPETGEIKIESQNYVIASRAWIYGKDRGLIKRSHLEPGMKITFKVTADPNGDPFITEIKLDRNSADFQRPS